MYEKQWDFLTKSIELGKLPHALLFYGQKDIGKKDFTIRLAEHLVGSINNNPDFILLEAEKGEIKISQIKELIQKLSFKPYNSDFKIAVVNNAHLMNQESQNCFLKFLEEPTEKTHLILLTPFPYLFLPTVLSRVQKLRFYDKQPEKTSSVNIQNLDMAEKFKLAKELAETDVEETLENWSEFFRNKMLLSVSSPDSRKLSSLIKEIEETKHLLLTTNVNTRLALEVLLMKI